MHFMPVHALLTSSLQYGIVSRSLHFTGKVLRGFLDASGTGLGIGNPNREFTPNISACALANDGGTALVLWGFRSGEISIVTASRAMEGRGRAAVTAYGCSIEDKHHGAVLDAVWGRNSGEKGLKTVNAALTAAADGRVKLWNASRVRCLWTSYVAPGVLVPDPCVKVAAVLERGIIVGAMSSGEVVVWSGLDAYLPDGPLRNRFPPVDEIRIPRPFHSLTNAASEPDAPKHVPTALYVDRCVPILGILIAYDNHPYFYRLRVDLSSHEVNTSCFGDASSGHVTAILPSFVRGPDESSFVVAGDRLGCISVYDWETAAPTAPAPAVTAVRKLVAHADGTCVSALAWNGAALATGSTRGVVRVWDALTLECVLDFLPPGPGPRVRARAREGEATAGAGVTQILLGSESDMLVAAVGGRVMAWRAGGVGRGKGKGKGVLGHAPKMRKWERAKYHREPFSVALR